MIEKILRAVKSSNKKRGRNITIGTVVGFLLSCSVIVGADEYLWIKEDKGIKFSTDNGVTSISSDPYSNINTWNESIKTYVNNMSLSGTDNSSDREGYGLKLSGNLEKFKFINNSSITGIFTVNYGGGYGGGYGISISHKGIVTELINNGSIAGISPTDLAFGIYNDGTITKLTNNSLIIGTTTKNTGYGIYNFYIVEKLINNDSIIGIAEGWDSYGIINSSGTITGLTNNGLIKGTAGEERGYGISNDGTITGLINNGLIKGTAGEERGYGISNDRTITGLTNAGLIIGTAVESFGIGITNTNTVTELINTGSLVGTSVKNSGYGIYNTNTIADLINKGSVIGIAGESNGFGIYNSNNNITGLANNGSIIGIATEDFGLGIYNNNSNITGLANAGLITGTAGRDYGYGIYNTKNIEPLINTGVIYGDTSAIINYGTVANLANYGILATKGSSAIIRGGTISTENHYGLQIKNSGTNIGDITAGNPGDLPLDIIVGYDEGKPLTRSMTIKNNQVTDGSGSFTGNNYNNSILNALKNTYKVTGTDNKVEGSIINAYGTAVLFNTSDNQLILSGTAVNGGIKDDTVAILGSDSGNDTLILEGVEAAYKDIDDKFQQTIVNGNINMQNGNNSVTLKNGSVVNGNITTGTGADTITIENGTQINGTLDGGTGNDTLNFGILSKTRVNSETGSGINIQHNISGFENMNINTNVTLFEKTVKNDGTLADLTITGAREINIGANGVLTLRIDPTNIDNTSGTNKIIGHALYGNNGVITSADGGKLMLALNGAGNNSIISFGDTQLDSSLVTDYEGLSQEDVTFSITSLIHSIKRVNGKNNEVEVTALNNLPLYSSTYGYKNLNEIYQGIISINKLGNFDVAAEESFSLFLGYLNDIYAGNPYSYSSELSRKSMGMFRDIVTENQFKPNINNWLIYGGLTHIDGGTKDTYFGKGYYTYDIGSSDMKVDSKITGAYMLGEYGISDTLTSGVIIGGNKLKSDLSNDSKVDGDALYIGAYAKKYIGNLKVTAGAGFQYGDYDTDRLAVNRVASSIAKPVMKYSDNYNDMTYDIYLNGRYSNPIGDNLFLESYATLSYTYIKQDGANEGSKALAIETDSKSFDYTVGKVGLDLKKIIPHSNGKSIMSAGVSYTKILDGAEEEYITGIFKGGSDFDILVAHKNQHSIGLNAKYALELESGILLDVKGTYSVERDSNNGSGKNKTKGEWIAGAGLGYKF